jgi:hypothetical protein
MRLPWSSESRRARRVRHNKALVQVPFVGRETLLASLDAHMQAAQEGVPQYIVLEGAVGSGKSSLLMEFTLLRCRGAKFFVSRVNTDGCISDWACLARLFDALQARSEAVLKRLYDDSKRIRKALSTEWDEEAFRGFLMSADWAEFQEAAADTREARERADVLTQLLLLVREHPWGVGAATILDWLMRPLHGQPDIAMWQRQWRAMLGALKAKRLPSGAVLVLVFDQLTSEVPMAQEAPSLWQSFVEAMEATSLPVLVIWAGSEVATAPVQQVLKDCATAATYRLEGLPPEDAEPFLRRLQRALPRDAQAAWQACLSDMDDVARHSPGHVLLAATSVAAQVEMQKKSHAQSSSGSRHNGGEPRGIAQAIDTLVQASRERCMVDEAVFDQCLEVLAFLPPETPRTVDEMMQLCHLETLGLEPADGREALETLLGVWVRYGLLQYDGFGDTYTTGQSLIQDGLRCRLYPNAAARLNMTSLRYTASSLLTMIQRGDATDLSALCASFQGQVEYLNGCASMILPAFRNMVFTMTKNERLQVAAVLAFLPAPFVIDMLQSLMRDEEDQVRSRAVQSLTELDGLDTFPLLLEALNDANSDVRWIAARALIDVDTAATVNVLIRLLTDEDKEVGRVAAEGLGRRGDPRAVPHLIEAMQDSYPLLRESAAVALGLLADQRAVPALREGLTDDSQKVRRSAEAALARFSV